MNPLAKALRFWHTVRHLKPVQVYGRARFRLSNPLPDLRPPPARRALDLLGAVAVGLIAGAAFEFFYATISTMAGPRAAHQGPLDNQLLPCICFGVTMWVLGLLPKRYGAPILVVSAAAVGAAYGALFG